MFAKRQFLKAVKGEEGVEGWLYDTAAPYALRSTVGHEAKVTMASTN